IHWNHASDDWQTSYAENNLNPGGAFLYRMEARDGSEGFDFSGRYSEVIPGKAIAYTLDDGRNVHLSFSVTAGGTLVTESFETEDENSADLQKAGTWSGALENYSLKPLGSKTLLSVDTDVPADMKSFIIEIWPKALEKLKTLCE
ncbi:MAG: SRPBCC domain-containing protein, partial [Bacteroidales bacterium]|nr:SRPBCC domain-containing protein [Bacteroidales bacterium]